MAGTMMRVAVAGTNTLALLIAHFIVRETSHQVVVLSRSPQPALTNQGYQVLVVDYDDDASLQHAVMGVDAVISTVTGMPELSLLKASAAQRVKRFAPAEFEGRPSRRPEDDPLDRGSYKKTIRQWLEYYRGERSIREFTIFSCGVLYERFGPGGLRSHRLGAQTNLDNEGDYIINARTMQSFAPICDSNNQAVTLCLTAAEDVARFVVKALDFSRWPEEMTMVGERMTVWELINTVVRVRGAVYPRNGYKHSRKLTISGPLTQDIRHNPSSLYSELQYAIQTNDVHQQMRAHDHIATTQGRYEFAAPGTLNRNRQCEDIVPIRFEDWLRRVWAVPSQ